MVEILNNNRGKFENEISVLQGSIANLAAHLAIDSNTRLAYGRQIKTMADELLSGKITWEEAASQA